MNYYLFSFYSNISYYIQNYYISNHGKPTNFKSNHFIMNNRESNEEEIQNCILSDPNNEWPGGRDAEAPSGSGGRRPGREEGT